MKKLFLVILALFLASPAFSASQWTKTGPAGTTNLSDLDYNIATINNEAVDRLLSNYRRGVQITYNSAADVIVSIGEVVCSNADGSVRKFRKNTAAITSTWTVTTNGLDTGSEAASTTYYIYAVADTDVETFTISISTNSSYPSPSGVAAVYYKKLGSFYNDASSNITLVSNDDDRISIGTGTVSSGGTISLPSGYYEDECNWVCSVAAVGDAYDDTPTYIESAASGRTCTSRIYTSGGWVTGTANYMIVCHR